VLATRDQFLARGKPVWFFDKFGSAINMAQLGSLYVSPDLDGDGAYEVVGNDTTNSATPFCQFAVNAPMTEAQATALYQRMTQILGVTDLTL
jgi:hypothetical protein